jgi:hypothetical protein
VSERLRRAALFVLGGTRSILLSLFRAQHVGYVLYYLPPAPGVRGFRGGAAPPKNFFLGRHIFAGFGPTYYRRADIFPGRHISGTT